MFLNICDGRNGYRRLYYFGDLKDQTQIRISLSANNKELPTNDEWWADAFRLSSVEDYQDIMLSSEQESLQAQLSLHLENFHLTSYSFNQISNEYLLSDFSNVKYKQTVTTHSVKSRDPETVGFDKIVLFKRSGTRWFRLWTSGLLEHGGIISCDT